MPVTIEDVLALLPEMFPGVQQIPLKNIRPNPNNPGPPLTAQQIQDLAQNIAEAGLLNPIKVRPDKARPLAGAAQLHPSNPRLRADGQPWQVGDFNYVTLTGVNRYWAFDYLKREAIPGSILNPTAKEAVKIGHLDNNVRERGWWAAYQTIEQYIQADPNLTQRQIGIELGMDKDKVNRALRLLPLLNAEARDLIVCNTDNSNKEIRGISEIAASQLAVLGPEGVLKPGVKRKDPSGEGGQVLWPYPPISPETQDLVRRSLEVAIDQEMGEAGVKGLVAWVQDGHKPEDYGSGGQGSDKTVPEKGKYKHEFKKIPVDRIRVHQYWTYDPIQPDEIERKALSMKTTGFVKEIMVRTLLDEERAADPDHDFELFEGALTFEAAKRLSMPMLTANVFSDMTEWEAVGLLNELSRLTRYRTWIHLYRTIEKTREIDPKITVTEAAIRLGEDTNLANQVYPVMALLNKSARDAIDQSIYECHEGLTDIGGYRFVQELSIPLIRLEKISKDLEETQKVVEEVVNVAIENEMEEDEIEELVDWALDGNDPREFYLEEAEG